MPRTIAGAAFVGTVLAFAACHDSTGSEPTATLLEVGVDSVELREDSSATFPVKVLDAEGRPLRRAGVTWRSTDSAVVRVNASGVAQGRQVGTAFLFASHTRSDGSALRDSVKVVVRPDSAGVHFVDLMPAMTVGEKRDFTVEVRSYYAPDSASPYTTSRSAPGAPVTFRVVRGTASITPSSGQTGADGRLKANLALGPEPDTVVVEVSSAWAGKAVERRVVVYPVFRSRITPNPLILTLDCEPTIEMPVWNVDGSRIIGVTVEFSLSDPTLATFRRIQGTGSTAGNGRHVEPRKLGSALIFGSWYSKSDTAELRILPQTPVEIELNIGAPVPVGETYRPSVSVTGDRAGGQAPTECRWIRNAAYTLTSLAPEIIMASGQELVGRAPGKAKIVAAIGAVRDTMEFTVPDEFLVPRDTTVAVGDTVRYRVVNRAGETLDGSRFSFPVVNSPVHTITAEGVAVTRASGTATIFGPRWYLKATLRVK